MTPALDHGLLRGIHAPVDAQQPRRSGAATLPPGGLERDGPTPGGEGGGEGPNRFYERDSLALQNRCNQRAAAFAMHKKTVSVQVDGRIRPGPRQMGALTSPSR